MRGTCDELHDIIDEGYITDMETIKRNIDKGVEFTGYTKTKMIIDKETKKWAVVSLKDGSTFISLDSQVSMKSKQ